MGRKHNQLSNPKESYSKHFFFAGSFIVVLFFASMTIGRYAISLPELFAIIWSLINGTYDMSDSATSLFFHIRLPRIIAALLVGAALSVAGSIFQGIFRNPLVSPDILGVTSGASFGAAIGILLPFASIYAVSASAFVFGIIAMAFAYTIATASKGESVIVLVLAGMVVSAFFTAGLSFIQAVADPYNELPAIIFWIMGGFFRVNWDMTMILIVIIIPCLIIAYMLGWKLDLLSLGDEEAASLGLNVKVLRISLIIVATVMVAASVSIAGSISWIGLVIPHIARMLTSSEHTISIPMSTLVGAGFLLLMDGMARNITASEIPISILTAALGAPFFAYLLIRRSNKVWNR